MTARIILEDDHHCFACGSENKDGLCVDWVIEGKTTRTEFVPQKKFQGWKGIVHGGILAALLDEAMTRLAWIVCGGALTAEMKVRYLMPAKTGEKLYVFGEIVKENRKLVETRATIHKENRILVAKSEGKAIKLDSFPP